jgi:hypothetical protein
VEEVLKKRSKAVWFMNSGGVGWSDAGEIVPRVVSSGLRPPTAHGKVLQTATNLEI